VGDEEGAFGVFQGEEEFLELHKVWFGLLFSLFLHRALFSLLLFKLRAGDGIGKGVNMVELLEDGVDVANAAQIVHTAFVQVLCVQL
jgi:hypothetical protein